MLGLQATQHTQRERWESGPVLLLSWQMLFLLSHLPRLPYRVRLTNSAILVGSPSEPPISACPVLLRALEDAKAWNSGPQAHTTCPLLAELSPSTRFIFVLFYGHPITWIPVCQLYSVVLGTLGWGRMQ